MNKAEIFQRITTRNGQFCSATWCRDAKTKAGSPRVFKKTSTTVRTGIEYDNTQAVKDGRADGTLPAQNAGLQWGTWEQYPYFITHKGQTYVRLYPVANARAKTEWYLDGKLCTYEDVEPFLLASEKKKDGPVPLTFTVKLADMEEFR